MTSPDPTHVFAYGSNLDPVRMAGRVPSARVVGRARLHGHELRFHKRGSSDGTGKANAFHTGRPDHVVHGVIYQVAQAELPELDVHEGGYERLLMELGVEHGDRLASRLVEAWVYLALPEMIDDTLLPTTWYVRHVVTGARAHGLPSGLAEWLQRHPSQD